MVSLLNPTVGLSHLPIATFFCGFHFVRLNKKTTFLVSFSNFQTLKKTVVIGSRDQVLRFKSCLSTQRRIQDLSEGQAQSQDSSVNTTSDVIAKRSLEGEALAFLGGPGACSPGKF